MASGPALAQVTADGNTVNLTPATATCASATTCFEAKNNGTINSNGNAIHVTTFDGGGGNIGAGAHDLGTINLPNGGIIFLGQGAIGLFAGNLGGTMAAEAGTITASGLTITALDGKTATAAVQALGPNSTVTLNGTTTLDGVVFVGFYAENNGGAITVNGPLQATLTDSTIALAISGRVDLLGGGTATVSGDFDSLFLAGQDFTMVGPTIGVLTVDGMGIQLTGTSAPGAFFQTQGSATIQVTNSTVAGTNTGPLFGIWAQYGGTTNVTLDNSQLTLGSAGRGIFVDGQTATVTLVNGSAITAFGNNATDSLAYVTNNSGVGGPSTPGGAGTLILNATDSTLSGNMLVDAPGAQGANALTANLHGTTQWTGNLTVNGAPTSTADVILTDTAHWTGAATNATNVTLQGGGTTWTMTDNSSITGTLTNGGTVAFQHTGAFHRLTTTNYVGNSGTLRMNTQLGADSSPTDQVIINGGTATGTTGIIVTNQGGGGALTTGKGIPIVVAQNGAKTTTDAFSLSNTVAKSVYVYGLFRGASGAAGADEQNTWYLRSHDDTASGGPFLPPGEPVPFYRPEVPLHSVYGAMARQLGLLSLGTFHERNGDQRLADTGGRERGWARVFGEHMDQSHSGHAAASLEGSFVGLQGGFDLWQFASLPGHRDNVGLFAAYTEGRANVSGFVLAAPDTFAGRTDFNATSLGGYWSHIAPAGAWYTDAVIMGTIYDGDGRTSLTSDVGVDGSGVIFSFEGGFTLARFAGLKLEPQAQVVYQYIDLDANDPFAEVIHSTPDAVHGRIGLRLAADNWPWPLRPYLKANIWQDFAGSDRTIYDGTTEIVNRHRATTLELGGGFVANIAPNIGLWASADYTTDIGGTEQERESVRGNAGIRIVW